MSESSKEKSTSAGSSDASSNTVEAEKELTRVIENQNTGLYQSVIKDSSIPSQEITIESQKESESSNLATDNSPAMTESSCSDLQVRVTSKAKLRACAYLSYLCEQNKKILQTIESESNKTIKSDSDGTIKSESNGTIKSESNPVSEKPRKRSKSVEVDQKPKSKLHKKSKSYKIRRKLSSKSDKKSKPHKETNSDDLMSELLESLQEMKVDEIKIDKKYSCEAPATLIKQGNQTIVRYDTDNEVQYYFGMFKRFEIATSPIESSDSGTLTPDSDEPESKSKTKSSISLENSNSMTLKSELLETSTDPKAEVRDQSKLFQKSNTSSLSEPSVKSDTIERCPRSNLPEPCMKFKLSKFPEKISFLNKFERSKVTNPSEKPKPLDPHEESELINPAGLLGENDLFVPSKLMFPAFPFTIIPPCAPLTVIPLSKPSKMTYSSTPSEVTNAYEGSKLHKSSVEPKTKSSIPQQLNPSVTPQLDSSVKSKQLDPSVKPKQLDPSVRPEQLDRHIRPKQIDPSVRPKQLVSTVRPKKIDPSDRSKQLHPSDRPKELDPTDRLTQLNPSVRPRQLDASVRPKQISPHIRPKQRDPSVRSKKIDPTDRPKQLHTSDRPRELDPSVRPKQLDQSVRSKQLDPPVRRKEFDPGAKLRILDPSVEVMFPSLLGKPPPKNSETKPAEPSNELADRLQFEYKLESFILNRRSHILYIRGFADRVKALMDSIALLRKNEEDNEDVIHVRVQANDATDWLKVLAYWDIVKEDLNILLGNINVIYEVLYSKSILPTEKQFCDFMEQFQFACEVARQLHKACLDGMLQCTKHCSANDQLRFFDYATSFAGYLGLLLQYLGDEYREIEKFKRKIS